MGFENLFEPSRLLTYFLIIMRMGGIFFTAPVFSSSSLNNQVRMILVLVISLLLLPVVTPVTITDPNLLWLVISVTKEILIGAYKNLLKTSSLVPSPIRKLVCDLIDGKDIKASDLDLALEIYFA